MAINPADAIRAFNQAARLGAEGLDAPKAPKGDSFSELLGKVAENVVTSGKNAEAMTAKAVAGEAEILEVVSAVSNAEMTLQTVVAVRDRVMSAYQQIMRMPI